MRLSCRRAALLLVTTALTWILASPAGAQVSVPPVSPLVDGVVDGVVDTVDQVTDRAGTPAPDLSDVVDDATGAVTEVAGVVNDLTGLPPVTTAPPATPSGPVTLRLAERASPVDPPADPAVSETALSAPTPTPLNSSAAAPSPTVAGQAEQTAVRSGGGDRQDPADLVGDDLANFGLPLLIAIAFVVFLAVEGRISGEPSKLADARLATRRPLRFEG